MWLFCNQLKLSNARKIMIGFVIGIHTQSTGQTLEQRKGAVNFGIVQAFLYVTNMLADTSFEVHLKTSDHFKKD